MIQLYKAVSKRSVLPLTKGVSVSKMFVFCYKFSVYNLSILCDLQSIRMQFSLKKRIFIGRNRCKIYF